MTSFRLPSHPAGLVSQALHALVSKVPPSLEPVAVRPQLRARILARQAALRAGAMSGTMALPPGPLGLATVLPDLVAVWRLQQQLVADIAAVCGATAQLTPEVMVVCLFRPARRGPDSARLSRGREGVLLRRVAASTLRQLAGKISIRITRRLAARGFSRWLPVLGAVGVGAYAYHETRRIAATALALFSPGRAFGPPAASSARRRPAPARGPRTGRARPLPPQDA